MDAKALVIETRLSGLNLMKQGKVRDIYDFKETLLIVATDRISAFDVVMDDPIPYKGRILTRISAFWFKATENIIANHMISTDAGAFPPECQPHRDILDGQSMWVRKAEYPEIKTTLGKIDGRVKKLIAFDATALALQAGSVLTINMVMLGALVQTGTVPLGPGLFRQVIRKKTKQAFVEMNLQAFDLGSKAAEGAG